MLLNSGFIAQSYRVQVHSLMKETVLLGLLSAWEQHTQLVFQNLFEIAAPFNLVNKLISGKGLHSKFLSPSRKIRPQHLPTSPLNLCFVNYYPMVSVCFGEKKHLSCFLGWTSAHCPGLNVVRCRCCGAQMHFEFLLGSSVLLEALCLHSCAYASSQLVKKCVT